MFSIHCVHLTCIYMYIYKFTKITGSTFALNQDSSYINGLCIFNVNHFVVIGLIAPISLTFSPSSMSRNSYKANNLPKCKYLVGLRTRGALGHVILIKKIM